MEIPNKSEIDIIRGNWGKSKELSKGWLSIGILFFLGAVIISSLK